MTTSFNRFRVAVFLVFFAMLWGSLWHQLSDEWSVNDQYSYGWFVPLFAIVLFWLRWDDRPEASRPARYQLSVNRYQEEQEKIDQPNNEERITNNSTARTIAMGIAILALVLLFPLRLFEIGNPDWRPLGWLHAICVVAITLVFLWSIGGEPWLKHFAFPVLFTLVAVPWISPVEAPIIQGLMRIIAAVAAETANLLGIPAQVQGNLIQVRTGLIGVNEACSGVRSLQTSLMIGLLFGELFLREKKTSTASPGLPARRSLGEGGSIARRFALVAGAIAIALIANFARAVFLVWLGADEGMSAIARWHDIAGYGIVACVFVGTLLLAWLLARDEVRIKKDELRNKAPSSSLSYFLIPTSYFAAAIGWIAFLEIAAASWYRAHEQNEVATPRWSVHWPNKAAGFRELKIDEGVRSTLRCDEALQAAWNIVSSGSAEEGESSGERCIGFFFRWKPGGTSVVRARAHRPDICLPAAGWRQISDRGVANYSASADLELPFHHLVFEDERGGLIAHTFFTLQDDALRRDEPRPDLQVTGGAQPDWGLNARARVVADGIRNRGEQILEVVLLSRDSLDNEAAETQFRKLLPDLIQSR
jgi:exosortase/archaeosortase family protein